MRHAADASPVYAIGAAAATFDLMAFSHYAMFFSFAVLPVAATAARLYYFALMLTSSHCLRRYYFAMPPVCYARLMRFSSSPRHARFAPLRYFAWPPLIRDTEERLLLSELNTFAPATMPFYFVTLTI